MPPSRSGSQLVVCPRTHVVGVGDVSVRGITCKEARRLAEVSEAVRGQGGFKCVKTSEGHGHTA